LVRPRGRPKSREIPHDPVHALRTQRSSPRGVRESAFSALAIAIKRGHVLAVGNWRHRAMRRNLHGAMRRMHRSST
jgi:hypothetical protein